MCSLIELSFSMKVSDDGTFVLEKVLRAGSLDNMDWTRPVGNIWTDSKAAWVEIDPALTNFNKGIADRTPLFDAWTRSQQD